MTSLLFLIATHASTPSLDGALAGGGLAFGTEIERPGLQGNIYLDLAEWLKNLRGGGDVTVFLPRSSTAGSVFALTFNGNGHYLFHNERDLDFYGLGGINLAVIYSSFDLPGGGSDSDFDFKPGINVGAGAEYALDFAQAFAEFKFVFSSFDQAVITIGLRFKLQRSRGSSVTSAESPVEG